MSLDIEVDSDVSSDTEDADVKDNDDDYGCQHYKRRCLFVTPCCSKTYLCRVCHDEAETHTLDRTAVNDIVCCICTTRQSVRKSCVKCKTVFGNYFCSLCRLFDDCDKGQFHCDGCGLCRVGGRDNFFHCSKCDMCLAVSNKDSHKCVEKMSHTKCPVCLEDLHTSRTSLMVPPCSHLIHRSCFNQMLKTGNYACPLCSKSMVDLSSFWKELDNEIAATPMPEEYKDFQVQILCRDCNEESRVQFHVVGLKCQHCASYNTCRTQEPPREETPADQESSQREGDGETSRTSDGGAAQEI